MPIKSPKEYVPQTFVLFCLGIFIFFLFFNYIETEDVWWHLSTGQWIIHHLQVPHEDPFPFLKEKIHWECYHWLGSTIFFLIFKAFGLWGLKIFRSMFFLTAIGVFFYYAYRHIPYYLLIVLGVLVSFGISSRPSLRPDLFNFVFVQIFLINLFAYQNDRSAKKLFVLPLIGILWFNIHIGAFFYGASLISIFLFSASLKCFHLKLSPDNSANFANAKIQVKDLALTLFLYLSAFMINPYGWEGFLYPFKVLLIPSFIDFYKISNLIGETQPPGHIFLFFNYFYFFVLIFLGVIVLIFNKKNNFTLTLLFIISLFAFLKMSRNSGFFTLVSVYIIVEGAKGIRFNDLWQRVRYLKTINYFLFIGTALFLLVHISNILNQKSYYNGHLINDRFLKVNHYSESSIDILLKNKILGPVFNQASLGGQLIWLGYPYMKPFQDSRFLSIERFNNMMAILLHPKEIWPQAEKDYKFKIVFLDTTYELNLGFLKYLGTLSDWQLISVNGPYVIYVKRGAFSLPEELNSFEPSLKSRTVTADDFRKLRVLLEKKHGTIFHKFAHATDVDLYLNFYSLFNLGYQKAALENLVGALKVDNQPDIRNSAQIILNLLSKSPRINLRI